MGEQKKVFQHPRLKTTPTEHKNLADNYFDRRTLPQKPVKMNMEYYHILRNVAHYASDSIRWQNMSNKFQMEMLRCMNWYHNCSKRFQTVHLELYVSCKIPHLKRGDFSIKRQEY